MIHFCYDTMSDPELGYPNLANLGLSPDDFDTIEAFLYNHGKIIIDKKDFYEQYDIDERRRICEISQKPKRKNRQC